MTLRFRLVVTVIALLVCGVTAQTDSPQKIQIPSGTSQGLLLHKVQPTYPPLARQARVQGTVVLHALIGKDGTIQDLKVVSGHPMLTAAAIEAVKLWRYKPYLLNGEPVLVETTINVNFVLNTAPSEPPPNSGTGGPSEAQPYELATESSSSGSDASNPPAAAQASQGPTSNPYPGAYRVGGGVSAPKAIHAPSPKYSKQARQAKYQGTVVLWLVVDSTGLPQEIRVQRSLGMGLDEEAVEAVKKWRFQPAMKDGQPVPVMINVEVNFRLD